MTNFQTGELVLRGMAALPQVPRSTTGKGKTGLGVTGAAGGPAAGAPASVVARAAAILLYVKHFTENFTKPNLVKRLDLSRFTYKNV